MKIFTLRNIIAIVFAVSLAVSFPAVLAEEADDYLLVQSAQTASGRAESCVTDICDGWRFGGRGVSADMVAGPEYDDSSWEEVDLPHTWNLEDGRDGDNYYIRTLYWYRRSIEWSEEFRGKRIYMEFLGSNQSTGLYINGEPVPYNNSGEYTHKGGYTAFRFDITDYLSEGENIAAVRVDNTNDQQTAPISGDFNMYGGIYRRVYLIAVNDVHVELDNYGSSGLFLKTPFSRGKTRPDGFGELDIRANIVNSSDEERTVTVTAHIDGDNAPEDISEELAIPANGSMEFDKSAYIEDPHLWEGISYDDGGDAPDAGYMYTVTLTVSENGEAIDEVSDKTGFRYFYADKDEGFFLNGKYHPLRGVNRHQYKYDKGSAMTEEEHLADMEMMKDLGVNAIRLCHYPQADIMYDLCDANGIVLWTEIPFVNQLGNSERFAESTKQQLTELIRQQYNRPSVCFWGMQNEVGNGRNSNEYITMKHLINELDAVAKEEDDSGRYTTQAIDQNNSMDQNLPESAFDDYSNNTGWRSDIIAWNIYPGWYAKYSGTFAKVMESKRKLDSRPLGISEYGWGANVYQHELYPELNQNGLEPTGEWHPEEYQSMMHEQAVRYINDNDYLWGTFVWVMFDFSVDSRDEGSQPALNDKGLVTGDRAIKKDAYYLYKANWNKSEPVIHITSSRYTDRTDSVTYVKVYSNCESVELFKNGESLGQMTDTGCGIFLMEDVELDAGENRISAVGSRSGDSYGSECVWTRPASSITELSSDTVVIDKEHKTVCLAQALPLGEFRKQVSGVNNASYTVLDEAAELTDDTALVMPGMKVRIVAEDGETTGSYVVMPINLCVNKSVSVSSSEPGNIAGHAVDNDPESRWVAEDNKYPQFLTVDLGEEYFISNLTIDWETKNNRHYMYTVSVSNDGESFEQVIDRSGNGTPGQVTDDLGGARGRYIRIDVSGCSKSEGYAGIFELYINGYALHSDIYDIDHEDRLIMVNELRDGGTVTIDKFDEALDISGNFVYKLKTESECVKEGDTLELTAFDGEKIIYTICPAYEGQDIVQITRAGISDGLFSFELKINSDLSKYDLYAAVYDDKGILKNLVMNRTAGDIEINNGEKHTFKLILWKKGTQTPVMDVSGVSWEQFR